MYFTSSSFVAAVVDNNNDDNNNNSNNNSNNNNSNNNNNNNSEINKNEEQPSTQGDVGLFDEKELMVFDEVEKKVEMVLKGPIDPPMVKTTNLYSTVTVGTA